MEWVVNATLRPLYPQERDPLLNVQEAGFAPGPVWTGAENLAFAEIRFEDRLARSDLITQTDVYYPCTTGYRVSFPWSTAAGAWR